QAAAKPVKLASSKCITRNRKAIHHDHLHVQSLGSGLRAIPHQPVGGPRQGGGLRRGEEGRAGGAAQHAARAPHVSPGAAGGRAPPSRGPPPPPARPPRPWHVFPPRQRPSPRPATRRP